MITTLTATTTSRIVSRLVEHEGTSGSSRVLTLVISTDEKGLEDALCAAHGASRDHPSRIIAVVKPPEDDTGRVTPRSRDGHVSAQAGGHLDAEIRVGHDAGAGETLVLRPWDEAALHTDTLVVPFLLPDAPVVVWWPTTVPEIPSQDPLGRLGSTRITNTPAQVFPARALRELAPVSVRGDIDLAWTRITLWRAMVASTLDPLLRAGSLREVVVAGEPRNSSLSLMIAWLRLRLDVPVTRVDEEDFKGISSITARTDDGEVIIARHDLEQAGYRPVAAVMVDGVGEVDLVLSRMPQAIVPGPAEGTHVLTAAGQHPQRGAAPAHPRSRLPGGPGHTARGARQ